ncbi:MAG: pyridoxamine 5'-phosphate oxidase family protein [Thermodesulfobacteriota bacterium]
MDSSPLVPLLQELFQTQRLAVLATLENGRPYLSLMVFAAGADLKHLIIVTEKARHKYRNLKKNPQVALLIDNRVNQETDFAEALAVTAQGLAEEVGPAEKEACLQLFLDKHPLLAEFAASPRAAVIKIKVARYLVVRKFQEVMELRTA